MARKTNTKEAELLVPMVKLELEGTTYDLCFDFAALIAAERGLRAAGISVNMLKAFDVRSSVDAERVGVLFYAALLRRQPEMTPKQAEGLIQMSHLDKIWAAVLEAYFRATVPAKEEEKAADPTVAAGEAAAS